MTKWIKILIPPKFRKVPRSRSQIDLTLDFLLRVNIQLQEEITDLKARVLDNEGLSAEDHIQLVNELKIK